MKIVETNIEILTPLNGDNILKQIEIAARNCYKSEDKITENSDSAKKIIKMLLDNHHEAMIEFGPDITVKLYCDVGVYKDLTRHRHCSFAIESTRYCNYSKDKFGEEIAFIRPTNICKDTEEYNIWYNCMCNIEDSYNKMAKLGCKPDQLRMLLPHSTAASVVMKANIREWRHILKLRTSQAAHPSVQQVMKKILYKFKESIPLLFDDIITSEESKYLNLKEELQNGILEVRFYKKDGSIRVMKCTLKSDILLNIQDSSYSISKKTYNPETISVFDIEKNDWRSFRIDSIIDYEIMY